MFEVLSRSGIYFQAFATSPPTLPKNLVKRLHHRSIPLQSLKLQSRSTSPASHLIIIGTEVHQGARNSLHTVLDKDHINFATPGAPIFLPWDSTSSESNDGVSFLLFSIRRRFHNGHNFAKHYAIN